MPFDRRHFLKSIAETAAASRFRRAQERARGERLDVGFLEMVDGDLMDPHLDVQTVYRDTRLQTWTLKPAIVP